MIPVIYKSTDNMMIQLSVADRRRLFHRRRGNSHCLTTPPGKFCCTVAEHAKTGAFSTFKISSYPANFLNAGQCIFAIDSTAGATWMGTDAPLCDISEDKIVSLPHPRCIPCPRWIPTRCR